MTEQSAKMDSGEVVEIRKKSRFEFFVGEILIYLAQIMVFFWVTFLISGSLSDEDKLVDFLSTKINDNSISEIGYIILGTIITFGIILAIQRAAPATVWFDEVADEILTSISRTIYFFGSSVTGSILAVSLFSYLNPDNGNPKPEFWLSLSVVFGVGAFLYGCLASYAFSHKKYVAKPSD